MRVLLIDDQILFRAGIAALLRELRPGAQVHHVGSVGEAAAPADRSPAFDIVVHNSERSGLHCLEACAAMRELADHMDRHLDFEDEHLVPLFADHFTADEYAVFQRAARKHLGLGKQMAYTVPFVMHWASPADREQLLAEAEAPLRVLYRLTRRGHTRLTLRALGAAASTAAVRS